MSWSATSMQVDNGELISPELVQEKGNLIDYGDYGEHVKEQVVVACEVAKLIAESGVIGKDKDYVVSLSGHANEGHEPKEGYANDYIAVSISQR